MSLPAAAAAYAAQPVNLMRDFVPVAGVATVPHMLVVAARQLGDPVLLFVLMEADDLPVHRIGSLDSVCGEPPPGQDETALNDRDSG